MAIAGDLHGAWGDADEKLLNLLRPDAVLFVGDLSNGNLHLTRRIALLPHPVAVILGNHDCGFDKNGGILHQQLVLLDDCHCAWRVRRWERLSLSVVGARPCSSGGGFHLSQAVKAVYGPVTLDQSVERILSAAASVPADEPLLILAHCGPTGLGSNPDSPCGRDWKSPAIDWGDQDLSIAIDRMAVTRPPDLVIFGHMHHALKRGSGYRQSLTQDRRGTVYLNSACVPRSGLDQQGCPFFHFSWAEFSGTCLTHLSHRWYAPDGKVKYKETFPLMRPMRH
ncbi:TIGR04168 family protein [Synechococcus sp. M16CYN]|uniref:TIGR04168 family protein n=1 Tax=Synechococcus sp. M16CYN TaxID=3103139 RepID=UPI0033408E9C